MHRPKYLSLAVSPEFCFSLAISIIILPTKWLLAWFLCVLLHETGHLIALKLFHIQIRGISFNGTGILIETHPMTADKEALCALAGPLIGILPMAFVRSFPHLAICSFALSGFNILPLYPMDGGRILNSVLSLYLEQPRAKRIEYIISTVTLCMLILVSLLCTIVLQMWEVTIMLCIFMIFRKMKRKSSCKEDSQIVQCIKTARGTR